MRSPTRSPNRNTARSHSDRPAARSSRAAGAPRLNRLAHALVGACLLGGPVLAGLPAHAQAQAQTQAPVPAMTLPRGMQLINGQAQVATQGAQMTVRNTPGAILNWQSFSIGANAGVYFDQASAASKVLNRVTGNDPSQILGQLSSNGQVWLLNPHGVLFGAGARVDVASLVTGTLRLADSDFLAGRFRFAADAGSTAFVRNEGDLQSSFGGQIVLLGSQVQNTGSISAPGGSVGLAAARSVELVDTGLPNLAVRVDVPAGEVLNLGRLLAAGGKVDVHGAIVNQAGLVQASSLGRDALGEVVLRASDTLTLGEASLTEATGGAGAHGGKVDLLGAQVAVLGQAVVDVSGAAGGGSIRLGGGQQGQDRSVPNARAVFVGPQTTLRADAGELGAGGRIVLWSDQATRAYGTLSARGGQLGGDGGFVETSGGWLDARPASVDVTARGDGKTGKSGTWLLDPNNILINNVGPDTNITGNPNFTTTDDSSVISTATIAAALNAGNSVSISTGTAGSNTQAGDIFMDAATLAVAPPSAVTLTLSAARDVVVRGSSISSSTQPLSLDLVAAGSGIGAVEIDNSSINTRGGNITLGGAIPQQLPLPDGSFTAATYRPAVGYDSTNRPFSQTSRGGSTGVNVQDSALTLGSGTFRAVGLSTVDQSDGVHVGSGTAQPTTISAATIDIVGVTSVLTPIGVDAGVVLRGDATNLTATQSFTVEGAGRLGLGLADGARLDLAAAPASGAVMTLKGLGTDSGGVGLYAYNIDTGTAGRGSRVTVSNGALSITGNATAGLGIGMFNDAGAPGPLLDLAAATSATFLVERSALANGFSNAFAISDVDLVLPTGGATTFTGDLGLHLRNTIVESAGGSLAMAVQGVLVENSLITATSGALALSFATTGANPTGLRLADTIINTGGGDVTFGASQTLPGGVLPATTVAAPWLLLNGSGTQEALSLASTVIDAGTGRIVGGGATTSSGVSSGVELISSNLTAREVSLAGRSDTEIGLLMSGGAIVTDRVLRLSGQSAGGAAVNGAGLFVAEGSTLQMVDATANAASLLALSGDNRAGFAGAILRGGAVGGTSETQITASGAPLSISGTVSVGGQGLAATGVAANPGGLLVNGLGATTVTLQGTVEGTADSGLAVFLDSMNVLGPQDAAGQRLDVLGSGGAYSIGESVALFQANLSAGAAVTLRGDGISLNTSTVSGDAGVRLLANTAAGSPAGAPIFVENSNLLTANAGAEIRIEGSEGDAVRGSAINPGSLGVLVQGALLRGTGAGSRVVVKGRGGDLGGEGVGVQGSTLNAGDLVLTGTGTVDGSGLIIGGTGTQLIASNLTLTGVGIEFGAAPSAVGVDINGNTSVLLSGRGTALITGNTVVIGGAATGVTFGGDAAALNVETTGSMRVRNATLDFTGGAGAAVTLRSDTDSSLNGRVRMDSSTVRTGGGDFTITGGSGAAVGVYLLDPQGNALPQNSVVREGNNGILLTGLGGVTIDAGAGTVTMSAQAATDGRPDLPTSPGGSGLSAAQASSITAGTINLIGQGGEKGIGIDVGVVNPGATLALTAGTISVTGRGVGIDPNDNQPYAGVTIGPGNTWQATSGALNVSTPSGRMNFNGSTLAGSTVVMSSAEAFNASLSTISAGGDITVTGGGTGGGALSTDNTTFGAGGVLSLSGLNAGSGVGIALFSGVQLVGSSVLLNGTAASGTGVVANAPTGDITATSGPVSITGRGAAGPAVQFTGGWAVQAPNQIDINTDNGLSLQPEANSGNRPSFSASQAFNLAVVAPGGLTLGDGQPLLDGTALGAALAGLPGTATTTLNVTGNVNALTVRGPLAVPSRLHIEAGGIELQPGAALSSTATGDAIVLRGAASDFAAFLVNTGGSNVLSAPNGRWVVLSSLPTQTSLGGLPGAFTAYGLGASPWATDASGNYITPAAGNAVGYSGTPQDAGSGVLSGAVSKVYDATTSILLDSASWVISGLLAGDQLVLAGTNTGTLDTKNVGTGKPVALSGGSVFTVVDAGGLPVFGYAAPVFTGTVSPALVSAVGTAAANKVYDGNTSATLASVGTVTPFAGDVLSLGGTPSASFADKNVGSAKPVLASGLTLQGADAGNYTLQPLPLLAADITPLALPVTGGFANNKVYDTTVAASLGGAAVITPVAGDVVTLQGTAVGVFADKNVGAAKPVSVSGLFIIGADAGNYTLQLGTLAADITAANLPVTGVTAQNKVYDTSVVATLAGSAAVSPLAGDTVLLGGTPVASFATKNVGNAKAVAVSGYTLGGADAGNYTLAAPAGLLADITPAALAATGLLAANKAYDGTATATLASAGTVLPLAGDVVALGGTPTLLFDSKNVGSAKPVSVSGLTLQGADAGNYTLQPPPPLQADVTPLALPVSGLQANNKVYDATVLAGLAGTAAISPVAGDVVTLQGTAAGSFADKNVGSAKPVAVGGLSLAGADAGNYTLQVPAGLAADISAATLTVAGLSASSRVYDGTVVATLAGTGSVAPLGADVVALAGTPSASFANKNVGAAKAVAVAGYTLSGADAGNYALAAPTSLVADITPALLTLDALAAAGKVYDGTTSTTATGTLGGVVAGDTVTLNLAAAFADRNVGVGKTVNVNASTGGADAGNYSLGSSAGSTTASIAPATLTFAALAATAVAGSALPAFTGTLTGFVAGDDPANATTGTLLWSSPATASSTAGSYAITGGGLLAANYSFVQAAANATALTLTAATTNDATSNATTTGFAAALNAVSLPVTTSTPSTGRVLDLMQSLASSAQTGDSAYVYRNVNFSLMSRDEIQGLLAARASYKKKVFAGTISKLEQDPTLADVRGCGNEAELATGNCLITAALKADIEAKAARATVKPAKRVQRKLKQAALPNIERKLALLIGINKYADKRIPELVGAVPDTQAVKALLESRLGYEATVVADASREAIIRAFNKLALEADANDSVIIYYAGHGVVLPAEGAGKSNGFWLPADSDAETPQTWISNADISRLVGLVGARQLMLISDSCYSGNLAGNERVQVDGKGDTADMLSRKAAVVMSSGGDEPVADEGRNGHSIFAWHLMQNLGDLNNWQAGGNVFERVRNAVQKDFPQTPQYGASRTAGHQGNTDYLFERREFDGSVTP